MHTKNMCLIATINHGSNVTSEKLSVLFCSACNLALHCKMLNKNIQRNGSNNKLKFQFQKNFWSNLLEKHQNFNCS